MFLLQGVEENPQEMLALPSQKIYEMQGKQMLKQRPHLSLSTTERLLQLVVRCIHNEVKLHLTAI